MFYLKDPSTNEPSPTLTMVVLGTAGAFAKLLVAGWVIFGFKMSDFSGTDFAMVVAPFIGLLAHKRSVQASFAKANPDEKEE